MLMLDGSYKEGGGQIVRIALFMSLYCRKPVRIFNIRKGRKKPGLKRQHLFIVKTLEKITTSKIIGARLGSMELMFYPGIVKGGNYEIDFGTAGSIPLYLQTLLPVSMLLSGKLTLKVKGGTDVPMGPTMEFTREAFLPFIRAFGADVEIDVEKRGYYPKGGGSIVLKVNKVNFKPVTLNLDCTSNIREVKILSIASENLKERKVAHRQLIAAQRFIEERMKIKVKGNFSYEPAGSTGSSITIIAKGEKGCIIGADALGAVGKPSERVGMEAAEKFMREVESGCCIDSHLADHLIPLIALGGGAIRTSRITGHIETAVWVVNQFIPDCLKICGNTIRSSR